MVDKLEYNNPMKYKYRAKMVHAPKLTSEEKIQLLIQRERAQNSVSAASLYQKPVKIENVLKKRIEKPSDKLYNYWLCGFAGALILATCVFTGKIARYIKNTSR